MLYTISGVIAENASDKRRQARPKHLERLQKLKNEGRLVLAGPHPVIDSDSSGSAGFSGSLIVAEFASIEEAQDWVNADPYKDVGVYKNIEIKPFIQVLP